MCLKSASSLPPLHHRFIYNLLPSTITTDHGLKMASSTITLKLLVDPKSNKVVYAEAQKDFVDFLFGLLELPDGTMLSLLVSRGMSGCGSLGKVYGSVTALDKDYLQSDRTRYSLFRPDDRLSDMAKPTPLLERLA